MSLVRVAQINGFSYGAKTSRSSSSSGSDWASNASSNQVLSVSYNTANLYCICIRTCYRSDFSLLKFCRKIEKLISIQWYLWNTVRTYEVNQVFDLHLVTSTERSNPIFIFGKDLVYACATCSE